MELVVSIAILTVTAGGALLLIGYLAWPREAAPASRQEALPTPGASATTAEAPPARQAKLGAV